MRAEGIYLEKNESSFQCLADTGHSRLWNKGTAKYDSSMAKSTLVTSSNMQDVPLFWKAKLQTEVAILLSESEYICLLTALQTVIYMMQLLDRAKEFDIDGLQSSLSIHCKTFETNSEAYAIARLSKIRLCPKQFNIKFHRFRLLVKKGINSNLAHQHHSITEQYVCKAP